MTFSNFQLAFIKNLHFLRLIYLSKNSPYTIRLELIILPTATSLFSDYDCSIWKLMYFLTMSNDLSIYSFVQINSLTTKKNIKTSFFEFIFISKQQQLFSTGDMIIFISNHFYNSFWH